MRAFFPPPQVAMTWCPASFASCTAICPVPPAAAVTSTVFCLPGGAGGPPADAGAETPPSCSMAMDAVSRR